MKEFYDFSKVERGKFYRADATFSLPIYLEPDVDEAISKLAAEKRNQRPDTCQRVAANDDQARGERKVIA